MSISPQIQPLCHVWLKELHVLIAFQGLAAGASVTVGRTITYNLIPSTIGCMVGGICFVAFASWYVPESRFRSSDYFTLMLLKHCR